VKARRRLGLLLAAMLVSGAGGPRAWGQDDRNAIVVADPRTSESSALAVSPTDDGLLYTVNDSGHEPVVYVIDRTDATIVGTTLLAGVDSDDVDPEAIAVDDEATLWVADIGDNLRTRDDIALYALPGPGTGAASVTPRGYPLRYADGPTDAETLLADPSSGRMWVVTKGLLSGSVLRVPARLRTDADNLLTPLADLRVPAQVTDGTVLPDGNAVVLRTYGRAYVYRLPSWALVGDFALPRQQQGESLTVLPDGRTLLAGSEGTPTRIAAVPLPERVVAGLAATPTEAPTPGVPPDPPAQPTAAPATDDGGPFGWWLAIGVAVAAVGAAGASFLRRRS